MKKKKICWVGMKVLDDEVELDEFAVMMVLKQF